MTRWAIRILMFLLLGAIVNVAVAWGCSQVSGRKDLDAYTLREDPSALDAWWVRNCPLQALGHPDFVAALAKSPPQRRSFVAGAFATGLNSWHFWMAVEDAASRKNRIQGLVIFAGWPSLALTGQQWTSDAGWSGPIGDREYVYQWAIGRRFDAFRVEGDAWGRWYGERMIPLGPLWPGFAINTVFYAIILWLLFAGPFVLRRRRRIRRGLCPKCAYDLRGTPEGATACPECGAVIPLSFGRERAGVREDAP